MSLWVAMSSVRNPPNKAFRLESNLDAMAPTRRTHRKLTQRISEPESGKWRKRQPFYANDLLVHNMRSRDGRGTVHIRIGYCSCSSWPCSPLGRAGSCWPVSHRAGAGCCSSRCAIHHGTASRLSHIVWARWWIGGRSGHCNPRHWHSSRWPRSWNCAATRMWSEPGAHCSPLAHWNGASTRTRAACPSPTALAWHCRCIHRTGRPRGPTRTSWCNGAEWEDKWRSQVARLFVCLLYSPTTTTWRATMMTSL